MNIPDKLRQVIAAVAPTLGTALGGPFAALAGTFISKALGTSPGDEQAIATAAASGNPEVFVKLKQAELDFRAHMADVGLSEDKLVFDDVANARGREIAVKDKTPTILAYGITVGFFGTLAFMLENGKPAVGGDALLVMLGSLGTAWAGVVAYFFGSSSGSARKDATLSDIAKGAP